MSEIIDITKKLNDKEKKIEIENEINDANERHRLSFEKCVESLYNNQKTLGNESFLNNIASITVAQSATIEDQINMINYLKENLSNANDILIYMTELFNNFDDRLEILESKYKILI